MPGKRSNRKETNHFCCPYCDRRLWRLGSPKHFVFYLEAAEIQKNVHISRKSATFLANKGTYVDRNCWIEDFFCGEHGKFWMKVTRDKSDKLVATIASTDDWQHSTKTINPEIPNPSVSEFSYRISRQAGIKEKTYLPQ